MNHFPNLYSHQRTYLFTLHHRPKQKSDHKKDKKKSDITSTTNRSNNAKNKKHKQQQDNRKQTFDGIRIQKPKARFRPSQLITIKPRLQKNQTLKNEMRDWEEKLEIL
jgi:hypothetical protein